MGLTIKQAAEKMNLTVYTLRYYEKEGLLPFVERDRTGNRLFSEGDMEWLSVICCLKNTGMPIKQIKQYIGWCLEGEETLTARKQMLIEHRREVLNQIKELKKNLEKIDYKISHYQSCTGPVLAKEKVVKAANL
jgi:DNA-binding transcriptional MerR regulator